MIDYCIKLWTIWQKLISKLKDLKSWNTYIRNLKECDMNRYKNNLPNLIVVQIFDINWSYDFYEVKWSESHSVVSNSLQPHGLYSPWNSSGQNTGVSRLSLPQGISPTQGSNLGLPHSLPDGFFTSWATILYKFSKSEIIFLLRNFTSINYSHALKYVCMSILLIE